MTFSSRERVLCSLNHEEPDRVPLFFCTTDDVRAEVRLRIKDLTPGGGFIAAPLHCLQPDVPPANIVAMYDEAQKTGRYPLQLK